MRRHVTLILVIVALCAWLYFSVPAATEAMSIVVDPLTGAVRRAVNAATGVLERARVVTPVLRDLGVGAAAGPFLALLDHESGFDPESENESSGAAGIGQIVPANWSSWGLDENSAFDARANVEACWRHLDGPHWSTLCAELPGISLQLRTALLYIGHAEGGGPMRSAINAITESGVSSWAQACEGVRRDYGGKGRRPASGFYNSPANMWRCGSYAADWQEKFDAGVV
jgi:hypothetical protein